LLEFYQSLKSQSNFDQIQHLELSQIFNLNSILNLEKVPVSKVVPCLIPYRSIFYLKFFELGKVIF
jgi:hypothetical protein